MARRIKVSAGVLNIRLHPHSPQRYIDFIVEAYRLKISAKIHGDRYGIISMLDRSQARRGVITGVITTFIDIDTSGTWFDTSDLKEASNDQVSNINIPENLHPNAASFYFIFDANIHKIYVQVYSKGKTLTANSSLKMFDRISSNMKMIRKFGEAKLTIVQDKSALDKIFKMKIIKEIRITILKPNADIFSDSFEDEIEAHLAETHAKKISIAYEADRGASVVPTKDVRAVSEVALENGNVEVRGRDETGAVKRSTSDFPKILQDTYDPDKIGEHEAFRRLIAQPNRER